MLPLPNHLLNIDPQDVIREIEADPLSEFVWSFRPNVVRLVRQPFATLTTRFSKSQPETCTATCGSAQ